MCRNSTTALPIAGAHRPRRARRALSSRAAADVDYQPGVRPHQPLRRRETRALLTFPWVDSMITISFALGELTCGYGRYAIICRGQDSHKQLCLVVRACRVLGRFGLDRIVPVAVEVVSVQVAGPRTPSSLCQ